MGLTKRNEASALRWQNLNSEAIELLRELRYGEGGTSEWIRFDQMPWRDR